MFIRDSVDITHTSSIAAQPRIRLINDTPVTENPNGARGTIEFKSKNYHVNPASRYVTSFAEIHAFVEDASAGTEDSSLLLRAKMSGTMLSVLTCNPFGSSFYSGLEVGGVLAAKGTTIAIPEIELHKHVVGDSSVTISNGDSLGVINWSNDDANKDTLTIKGVASENHYSAPGMGGGSKFEFYTTPVGGTSTALAADIGSDKSFNSQGDITSTGDIVAGGDIVCQFPFSSPIQFAWVMSDDSNPKV